jgi:hypothetical protein
MPRDSLGHPPAVVRLRPGHWNQVLHRHLRGDRTPAHLLLNTLRKQFNQTHVARHPAGAAIKTTRQLFQPIAEALFQFHKQPALFQRCVVFAPAKRSIQKQSLRLVQRPDHCLDRVPAKLLQRPDALIAVDHQITIRLPGGNHNDRHLLTVDCQRGHKPPLRLGPMHPKMLKATLQLMKFQTHIQPVRLHHSTLQQTRTGIAPPSPLLGMDPHWNQ